MCTVMWQTTKKRIPAWREAKGCCLMRICPEYLENKTHQAGCCTSPTHTEASGGFDLFEEVFHNKRVNGCWQGNCAQHADICVTQTHQCAYLDDVSGCRLSVAFVCNVRKDFLMKKVQFLRVSWPTHTKTLNIIGFQMLGAFKHGFSTQYQRATISIWYF